MNDVVVSSNAFKANILKLCESRLLRWPLWWCFNYPSVINNIGAGVLAIDAVCMGLLAAAAIQWEGTDTADDFSTAVVVLQLLVLCGELLLSDNDHDQSLRQTVCGVCSGARKHLVDICTFT